MAQKFWKDTVHWRIKHTISISIFTSVCFKNVRTLRHKWNHRFYWLQEVFCFTLAIALWIYDALQPRGTCAYRCKESMNYTSYLPSQMKHKKKKILFLEKAGLENLRKDCSNLRRLKESKIPMSQDRRVTPRSLWQEWQTFGTSQRWMHCKAFTATSRALWWSCFQQCDR